MFSSFCEDREGCDTCMWHFTAEPPPPNINNPQNIPCHLQRHCCCYSYDLLFCWIDQSCSKSQLWHVSHCTVERIHYRAISLCNLLFPAILTISPLFSPSTLRGPTCRSCKDKQGRMSAASGPNPFFFSF